MNHNKDFYSIVSGMNNDDLNQLINAIGARRSVLAAQARNILKVGDPIHFTHKNTEYIGTITSLGRTRATVSTNRGNFTVPCSMLGNK